MFHAIFSMSHCDVKLMVNSATPLFRTPLDPNKCPYACIRTRGSTLYCVGNREVPLYLGESLDCFCYRLPVHQLYTDWRADVLGASLYVAQSLFLFCKLVVACQVETGTHTVLLVGSTISQYKQLPWYFLVHTVGGQCNGNSVCLYSYVHATHANYVYMGFYTLYS